MGIKPSLKPSITDKRISTCKRCGFGIFTDEPWMWSRSPLGLVHTGCHQRATPPKEN